MEIRQLMFTSAAFTDAHSQTHTHKQILRDGMAEMSYLCRCYLLNIPVLLLSCPSHNVNIPVRSTKKF